MGQAEDERAVEAVVAKGLRSWLSKAKDAVLRPWRQFRGMPDAGAVYSLQPDWDREVETILATLSRISMGAWSEATDVPPVSRHAFIVASLADAENLMVRMPDEVANLIFAEINDTVNAGGDTGAVARQVEKVLSWTDSERWPGRARTIARTESTRARGAGTLGAGTEQARVTGRILQKQWVSHHDERTRIPHFGADGQTVPFYAPFLVGGEPLMFPGDPMGSPENVINCRCYKKKKNEVAR